MDTETTRTHVDPQDLARRYVAAWIEPDPARRRAAIEELWADDGGHVLQPPEVVRTAAAGLGFRTSTLEVYGHDAIEHRVATSYQELVAPGEYTFRPRANAARLNDVVRMEWEMVDRAGEVVADGLDVLLLDADGRIKADYMFPGP